MSGSPSFLSFAPVPLDRPAANDALSHKVRVFQLAAAVDAYELAMSALLERWFDSPSFLAAETAVWEVRAHGVGLPELAVPTLELCLAHAEIVALLWRRLTGHAEPETKIVEARARRDAASDALRAACASTLRSGDA